MAFWDFLKRPVPQAVFSPNVTYVGGSDEFAAALGVNGLTPAQMWASQPHLRTVVSFLARNVAQLGLHTFARDGDDRRRDRTSRLARALAFPNEDQTAYDLVFSLVGDLALYDRAYWMLGQDRDTGEDMLRRVPPSWVSPSWANAFTVEKYRIGLPGDSAQSVDVAAADVLAFTGYHPSSARTGSPTVEALKGTLQEQIEASKYRAQVWKRGGRVSAVLQRPKDAPPWSDGAREAFRADWYAKYTGSGSQAGGTPLLEDGMTLNRIDFTAQEQQFVEAAKLSFATVASAFHVNPTMVGILDNANYSNVREFRRMLYGDTLGPLIAQIESRINAFLVPRLGGDRAQTYVEFNIAEKLQGSFEEQAAVMQTLVGAPLFTRNEGRARFNMPALPEGDGLVTPLNVLIGGQASPTDSGSQNRDPKSLGKAARLAVKAAPSEAEQEQAGRVLAAFFDRQGKAVLSRIGSGGDWWDVERWDRELAEDLLKVLHALVSLHGEAEAKRAGFGDDFDADATIAYLTEVAKGRAGRINETTRSQVADALDADDSDPAAVLEARASRASAMGATLATFAAGWAVGEAARQIRGSQGVEPSKTWETGPNPRDSHARMDGETVPIDEPFSNGVAWPGDGSDADEVAGCNCTVSITY